MAVKTISIKEEHEQWIIERDISLSRYVQKKIESDMAYENLSNTRIKE